MTFESREGESKRARLAPGGALHLETARGETAVLTPTKLHRDHQQSHNFCLPGVTPATVTMNAVRNQEAVVPWIWGQGSGRLG